MKRPCAWAVVAVGDDVVMVSAASFLVFDVTLEGACGCEFTQLVPNHLFSHEDWNVGPAVMNGNCVADHHWKNCGGPRPRFDDRLVVSGVLLFNLAKQAVSNEGAFFERSSHGGLSEMQSGE